MPKRKAAVLIVDDEESVRLYLSKELSRKNFLTFAAQDAGSVFEVLSAQRIDVVLLDILMPGIDGMVVLEKLRVEFPLVQVVMLTGNASIETAVKAMRLGACDYLTKPYDLAELCLVISRALEESALRRENLELRACSSRDGRSVGYLGNAPQARAVRAMAEKASQSNISVLIRGETGTGKEVVARLIHESSPVAEGPFMAVNCSCFQDSLLESELFGHERGAFTDASRQKLGLVELADGGTLFLDEIGDMSSSVQAKMLRFLDSGEFRRLGGTRNMSARLRIVSATNVRLMKAIERGEFRQDLYYRLNVMMIRLPPLRVIKQDIPLLAANILERICKQSGRPARRFSPQAVNVLKEYSWPGNVRELGNIIERVVILSEGREIGAADIGRCLQAGSSGEPRPTDPSLAEVERCHILKILDENGGNKARTARVLGIDTKTLYNKLRQYGVFL